LTAAFFHKPANTALRSTFQSLRVEEALKGEHPFIVLSNEE
jgi:hypothetical protein